MINEPPDSAVRFAAWRSARADESEKSTGTNMRRGLTRAPRLCLAVFVVIFVGQRFQREELRQLPPFHDAEQRVKQIPTIPGPTRVAGEFRRRSGRFFADSPFRTSILLEFPSRVQRLW